MSQAQLARGCQFGNHGEAFLWFGSCIDEVDIAIMQLINLAQDNPRLAMEAAEFVSACVHDAAEQSVQRTGRESGQQNLFSAGEVLPAKVTRQSTRR